MVSDKYQAASVFYILGGAWLLGWWLIENPIPRKREGQTQWRAGQLKQIKKRILGAFVSIAITAIMCVVTDLLKTEQELKLLHGLLIPASDPDPPNNCSALLKETPPDALRIHIGKVSAYSTFFPYTILAVDGKKELVVDRDKQGRLGISLDIRSEDNRIIAKIERGNFTLNQNNILDMQRPDRSTLIVRDQFGTEALNVRYLNQQNLELSAVLHYPGSKAIVIRKEIVPDICVGNVGDTAVDINTHSN